MPSVSMAGRRSLKSLETPTAVDAVWAETDKKWRCSRGNNWGERDKTLVNGWHKLENGIIDDNY